MEERQTSASHLPVSPQASALASPERTGKIACSPRRERPARQRSPWARTVKYNPLVPGCQHVPVWIVPQIAGTLVLDLPHFGDRLDHQLELRQQVFLQRLG